MSSNYDRDNETEGTPSYVPEDGELEMLGWPRCLSAVPEDVMELLDDSESESESE